MSHISLKVNTEMIIISLRLLFKNLLLFLHLERIIFNFVPLPSFEWFIAGRMLNAFFVIGIFETTFTFLLEFVGGNKWGTVS